MDPNDTTQDSPEPPYLPPLQFLQSPQVDVGVNCELSKYERITNAKGEKMTLRTGTSRASLGIKVREPAASQSALVLVTDVVDDDDGFAHTELEIQSLYMKEAIKQCVPSFAGLDIERKSILLHDEPRCLFHHRDALIKYHQHCADNNRRDAALHVKFLLDYMFNTLSSDIRHFTQFMDNPLMQPALDYFSLWMAFVPGELVYVSHRANMHHQLSGRLCLLTDMARCRCKKPWCSQYNWRLKAHIIEFDGTDFGHAHSCFTIPRYDGVKALQDLHVVPLKYHPNQERIRHDLIARGKKFAGFTKHHYAQYAGVAELLSDNRNLSSDGEEDWFPQRSTKVNGRIIIDGKACYEARPSLEPCLLTTEKWFRTELGQHLKMSDEEYMICSDVAAGYSLEQKKWGFFSVDSIQDIEFNDDAFDSLIIQEDSKKMMLALVKSHAEGELAFDDVIKGKGKGLIFLLYGEPGTGKTLTAESIADYTRMPLLRMDAAILGLNMTEVQENLASTFSTAERWNAITLLDEADVFLEQRRLADMERNRLVAAFLQVLEYFSGIIFLTTNRIDFFDKAFKSRIHMALYYPPLDLSSRSSIWQNLLTRPGLKVSPEVLHRSELNSLAGDDLNGRQIKNVVQIANALAVGQGVPIGGEHLRLSLAVMNASNSDFDLNTSNEIDEEGIAEDHSKNNRPCKRRRIADDASRE